MTTAFELPTELPGDVAAPADVRPAYHVYDDSLAMARGMVFGLAAAAVCWVLIGVAIWVLLNLV